MAGVLFEDIFDVKDIDPEGKSFDRGTLSITIYFLDEFPLIHTCYCVAY